MSGNGGSDDGEDFTLPEVDGVIDESRLDVPNCPACLHRMEVAETEDGGLYWACPACRQVQIA